MRRRQIGVPFGLSFVALLEKSNACRNRLGRMTTKRRIPSNRAMNAKVRNGTRLPKNSYNTPEANKIVQQSIENYFD